MLFYVYVKSIASKFTVCYGCYNTEKEAITQMAALYADDQTFGVLGEYSYFYRHRQLGFYSRSANLQRLPSGRWGYLLEGERITI